MHHEVSPRYLSRRLFLSSVAAPLAAATPAVSFGIIADVHHGLMPDAHDRLRAFIDEAGKRKLDFVIQMGDFCHPSSEAKPFLETWHSYRGVKHNVLGNHDMDFGTKRQIMDRLQMSRSYYSFDLRGFHFVILDCNYINLGGRFVDFAHGNYFSHSSERDWVNPEQIEWLSGDLAATSLPSIVFTHQPINGYWNSPPPSRRQNVRDAFAAAHLRKPGCVAACFSGHEHVDAHVRADGINYVVVNSSSYFWVGEELGRLAKYRDPLFCFVTIDAGGELTIEGRRSEFIPPSPLERKHPKGRLTTASIENRRVQLEISRA